MLNKILTYFIVFCAFYFINAQNTFNLNYTSGIKSAALGIRELELNKYFVNSVFVDSTNGQQGMDVKLLDGQGAIIKRKRYLFGNIDFLTYFNNVFQYQLSGSTELVSAGSYSGSTSVVIITSVNKTTLDTNWKKFYYDGVYSYNLNSVFKTKLNEFWYFGTRGGPSRPCALKIDSSGNVLSVKEFTNLINYNVKVSYYDPISNLIYLAGKNVTVPTNQIPYIACIDTLGNVLWNQQNYGPIYFGQIERKNNYLIVCGSYHTGDFAPPSTINPIYKMNMLKINASNGSVIWHKQYGQRRGTNYLSTFVINGDESIASSGCYYYELPTVGGPTDGILLKVNSSGDSLWSQTYSNFSTGWVQESFYDIKKTQDGGYIMSGAPLYAVDPASQSWVVKTDSLGNAPGMSTRLDELTLEGDFIKLFPNPVKDKLNIFIKEEMTPIERVTVEVFNIVGQMILKEERNGFEKEIQLNTSEIKNGTYSLQLKTSHGIYKSKFIVVQ